MEKSLDEITSISTLVQQLAQQVTLGQEQLSKVQHLAQELSGNYQELSQESTKSPEVDEETLLIQKLEQDRLTLVMDLQQQDYIQEKLLEIIEQNEDTVETVKDYLQTKDQIRREERDHADKKFKYYVDNTLQSTIDQLNSMSFDLNADMKKVEKLVQVLLENTGECLDELEGQEYVEKLSRYIKGLNDAYNDIGAANTASVSSSVR